MVREGRDDQVVATIVAATTYKGHSALFEALWIASCWGRIRNF
jgi:hypothetical protein